ncbi:MAG: hypothetical protein CSYNP_02843 [Syntrophus sp. SKADARSKE-3]|nr:hypothetical protein [Syntrophus sp. SKADARSKE-3]
MQKLFCGFVAKDENKNEEATEMHLQTCPECRAAMEIIRRRCEDAMRKGKLVRLLDVANLYGIRTDIPAKRILRHVAGKEPAGND